MADPQETNTRRWLAAKLIGCGPSDLLGYADYGPGLGVVAIGPDGRKHAFSDDQLEAKRIKIASGGSKPASRAPATVLKTTAATKSAGEPTQAPAGARKAPPTQATGKTKK